MFDNVSDDTLLGSLPHETRLFRGGWLLLAALIFSFSIIGNVMVLLLMMIYPKMLTVTNVYLAALAVADFLHTLSLPFLMDNFMTETWRFGAYICKFYWGLSCVNWFASVFFLVALSFDRYLAVCHPIDSLKWRSPTVAFVVVAGLFLLSIILMLPILIFAESKTYTPEVTICRIFWPMHFLNSGDIIFISYSFLLGFFIPLCCIFAFYSQVVCKLAGLRKMGNSNRNRHRRVNLLVFMVILVYMVSWLPYWVNQLTMLPMMIKRNQKVMTAHASRTSNSSIPNVPQSADRVAISWKVIATLFFQLLGVVNCAANPILYAFMSHNFKMALMNFCPCFFNVESNLGERNPPEHDYHSTGPTRGGRVCGATTSASGLKTTRTRRSEDLLSLAKRNGWEGISSSDEHRRSLILQETDIDKVDEVEEFLKNQAKSYELQVL